MRFPQILATVNLIKTLASKIPLKKEPPPPGACCHIACSRPALLEEDHTVRRPTGASNIQPPVETCWQLSKVSYPEKRPTNGDVDMMATKSQTSTAWPMAKDPLFETAIPTGGLQTPKKSRDITGCSQIWLPTHLMRSTSSRFGRTH